jgi:hypothetical protein
MRTRSLGYARVRFALGLLYIGFGILIMGQMVRGSGLHSQAIPGLVLGAAMIGLGFLRVRGGWPKEAAR